MSKGLEELKKIKNYKELTYVANITGYEKVNRKLAYNDELKQSFRIVEKELKDYESHKVFLDNVEKGAVTYTPRDTWEEERKKLKALEIIKIKNVSMECLKRAIKGKGLCWYNSLCRFQTEKLTEDEFDSLKEVLL